MEIYIVQPGDTITSIANKYGITVERLVKDNGMEYTSSLVPGQALIITFPSRTHTVQEGDTLNSIAEQYGIPFIQLLRYNSFLSGREYIFPGEDLVISYNTNKKKITNGYTYTYIRPDVLVKTLPSLTYLSVFNYGVNKEGDVISYGEDTEIIQTAKAYGVAPLMMLSSFSLRGELNIELIYQLLISDEYSNRVIDNILNTLKTKGFYGINILISNLNEGNQNLYLSIIEKESKALKKEGYYFAVTINPHISAKDGQVEYEQLDYSRIAQYVNNITFLQYTWGTNTEPPGPVSSAYLLRSFISDVTATTKPEIITLGKPLVGYDWVLPYRQGITTANSMSINSALSLANDTGSVIQFDEISQTPYFQYISSYYGNAINHIVWFIDVRSIAALTRIIDDYNLAGTGIWNLMVHYQQMWTLLNTQYDIVKVLPELF